MADRFPRLRLRDERKREPDFNPAIRLFGRRFPVDQTVPELLLELLLVATSPKRVNGETCAIHAELPDLDLLRSWPPCVPLEYAPKARLNLKLFAFFGSSQLHTRHEIHRQQYKMLVQELVRSDKLTVSGDMHPYEVVKTLENLFLGFQSIAGHRTWCAQSFLPIVRELIAGESIWGATEADRDPPSSWEESLKYFSHNKQSFLARGGELLYLQLCNALRQDSSTILSWLRQSDIAFLNDFDMEPEPSVLFDELGKAFLAVLDSCPRTVSRLAEFLDCGVESATSQSTDTDNDGEPRFVDCGWCPEESWPEGLLFALEFLRICRATVDPIDRLEMLEIACAMQVLRSLCAQAARYTGRTDEAVMGAGPLKYVWAISDPSGRHAAVKQISRRNVNTVQRMIYDAIRHPSIRDHYKGLGGDDVAGIYREADRRYGHKLFLTLAKRIGLIVPKRGAGARFVLTERLLRYLVLSTIRPGERVTYDSFKRLLFAHHGLATDDESIGESCLWSGTSRLTTLGGLADDWLVEMLDASGMLIRLSDSCSLVVNPFDDGDPRV